MTPVPRARRAQKRWLEVAVAVVIAAAGLGTSWSAYQASLWNSVQATHSGYAGYYRIQAARTAMQASTTQAWEVGLLSAWLEAKEAGRERLAAFYEKRFPAEFRPAFHEWLAQDPLHNPQAAPSPFRLPSYREPGLAEAEALDRKASAAFDSTLAANRNASAFMRGVVIFSLAMFFAGIAQVFRGRALRIGLVAIAVLVCAWGFAWIMTLPPITLAGTM